MDQIETTALSALGFLQNNISGALNQLSERLTDWTSYPFLVSQPDRLHIVYLVSFVAIVFAIFLYRHRKADHVEIGNFFKFLFPKSIYSHKSSILDFKYYIINRVFVDAAFLVALIESFFLSSELFEAALQRLFHSPGHTFEVTTASQIFYTAAIVVAADLGFFIGHYLGHKVPLFWEFHKVHHSAPVLNPITNYRFHPLDRLQIGFWIGILTGIVKGGYGFIFANAIGELPLVSGAILLLLYLPVNLRHSHIWLSYGRRLSHILSSPAQHQIHHGTAARHLDKNFGLLFSVWDYLAGTLYIPKGKEELVMGLTDQEHEEYDSVWKLYTLPLVKATRLVLGRGAPAKPPEKERVS